MCLSCRKAQFKSDYTIIIGGKNFGCGSCREHAPLALAEAGVKAVVAEFYARIFFRNCVNGGYLLPTECEQRLVDKIKTGDDVEIDVEKGTVTDHTTGESFQHQTAWRCEAHHRSRRRLRLRPADRHVELIARINTDHLSHKAEGSQSLGFDDI